MSQQYDAIVIGGGHNGLVAGFYLARSGLRVAVLERRHVVGGACVTEEIFPGYWGHTGANLGAWTYPKVIVDMELQRHGLDDIVRTNPGVFTPFPDGRCFAGWREKSRTVDEIKKFSAADVEPYFALRDYFKRFAAVLNFSFMRPPPTMGEVLSRIRTPEDEEAFNQIMFGTAKDFLDEHFESEEIKAILGIVATVNNFAGPSTPGSPYMWLHRSLMSDFVDDGGDPRVRALRGVVFRPRGGMGGLSAAMERSLEAAGAVVRKNAEVARILVADGRVTGVALADGEEIASRVVLSNLDPKATFLRLLEPVDLEASFRHRIDRLDMEGSCAKVVIALDGLPRWRFARSDEESDHFSQCHFRLAPSLAYMDQACADAKAGRPANEPILWGVIPSAVNPSMAPPGKHIVCLTTFHYPYRVTSGDENAERDAFARRCIDLFAQYAPNVRDIVVDYTCATPKDLERRFGMTEGHITHGNMMPGHVFSSRPIPGWSDYRTPVHNLYLCGSGAFPGGSVSGIPGHNAAHKVLRDLEGSVA